MYIPTFWDLYSNSYVWLEQSMKMWAIVGKNDNIATAVPFEWGMALKHRMGTFRAQIELIKNSGEKSKKVELKIWQGRILEKDMSRLFSRV